MSCPVDDAIAKLAVTHGSRPWRRHGSPLDELVLTVLSQHTADANTATAFGSLRARFPTWEEVRAAPTGEVVDAIRRGGLANRKGPRIKAILDQIVVDHGSLTLDELETLPMPETRRRLLSLPGVGPKTAACVQLFSLGQPALPVDTHVHRVARRIGWIGDTVSAEAAQPILEGLLGGNRDRVYAFHMTLIAHGRSICRARRPECGRCPLNDCCDAYLRTRSGNPRPGSADDVDPSRRG